jgi:hypothetical protein
MARQFLIYRFTDDFKNGRLSNYLVDYMQNLRFQCQLQNYSGFCVLLGPNPAALGIECGAT